MFAPNVAVAQGARERGRETEGETEEGAGEEEGEERGRGRERERAAPRLLGRLRLLFVPAQAVRDAVHVRVDTDADLRAGGCRVSAGVKAVRGRKEGGGRGGPSAHVLPDRLQEEIAHFGAHSDDREERGCGAGRRVR